MLRKDVIEAVREDRFHVWAASTVEEGIEILAAATAGGRGSDGAYPPDSVFGRTDAKLTELAEGVRAYGLADLSIEP
jgi:Lon-like ATP-dependent protease